MENTEVINQPKVKKDLFMKRIHEVDFVRGLLIIIVVLDHLFWNLKYYGGMWWGEDSWVYIAFNFYWTSTARSIIQPLALMAFCFVSGISCAFSKNNWKRAIEMVIFWLIITIGSNVLQAIFNANSMDITVRVDINIIGVLALSTLCYCFVQKKSWRALLACIVGGLTICYFISPMLRESLLLHFGGYTNTRPGINYGENGTPNFFMPLFWEYPVQADFVPLFPFIIVFFFGAFVSYFVYKDKRQSVFPNRHEWERPVCFVGRHTLVIYLAHFIIMRGIFMIIHLIITGGIA